MDGYNATVFAYGATGCGKTYTMIGTTENQGLVPLCLKDLFLQIAKQKKYKQIIVYVSMLQIYNQYIKDLLVAEDRNLDIRQDPKTGITISGISQIQINSSQQMMTLIKVGNRNRTKEATSANQQSSRSHAILQITIESKQNNQGIIESINSSKLTLVDLAGSQRGASTTNKGQRMIQGSKINKSLLVLGNCIQALADAQEKNSKKAFIPYRGSKLTRLLKDSLGGNCKTVMIANISPAVSSFEDTYNTLNYANRAKCIKTNAQKNVLKVQNHISNYMSIIEELKKQNQVLKIQLNDEKTRAHNNGLPAISASIQLNKIKYFQKKINQHFNHQSILISKVYQLDDQIQSFAVDLFKLNLQKEKADQSGYNIPHLEQKIINKKQMAKTLKISKEQSFNIWKQYESKRQILINVRDYYKEIKNCNLSEKLKKQIILLFKSSQTMFQKKQIQFREHKIQLNTKSKDYIIQYLKDQLKFKQKVIKQKKTNSASNILDTLQTQSISIIENKSKNNNRKSSNSKYQVNKKNPSSKVLKFNKSPAIKPQMSERFSYQKHNISAQQSILNKQKKDMILHPDRYMKYQYQRNFRNFSPNNINYKKYDNRALQLKQSKKNKISYNNQKKKKNFI